MSKKHLFVMFLASMMIFVLAACGSGQSEDPAKLAEEEGQEIMAGGWQIADNDDAELPKDVRDAFEKAEKGYDDYDLIPVAYVGSQVVAGTNYMILCEAEAKDVASYKMVVVYADLKGGAQIAKVADFDLANYTQEGKTQINPEKLTGGWEVPDGIYGSEIAKEARGVFDVAVSQLDGSTIEPIALLGTQIVAGTNYAFLCKSTLTTTESVSGIQIVTLYGDLDGGAQVTGISTLDPADFNQ